MAGRVKRRRLNSHSGPDADEDVKKLPNPPSGSLTEEGKQPWHGFCEIESEPALFNVMLKEFGVSGVKVQEVVSLDDEMLDFLHKPIYGLIFLFRWKEDDPDKQEASCPEGIWFANQTASYACASVALLNIINNVEDIDLGERLQGFKEFTMPFTPALRGDAIGNFKWIKQIHNSFARKMDVLNIDLALKNEATARKSKGTKKNQVYDESEAGFHFIAFVPTQGKVWKFDGLERQPQSLGEYSGDNWLDLAKPDIIARMSEYEEDQIEFSILSVARDPLRNLTESLASNIKSLLAVEERISTLDGPISDLTPEESTLYGPDPLFDIASETLERASVPEAESLKYESATPDDLANYRQDLIGVQAGIRASIREEQESRRADEDYAAGRRHDYGPAVHAWVRLLARKGVIEGLVAEI